MGADLSTLAFIWAKVKIKVFYSYKDEQVKEQISVNSS